MKVLISGPAQSDLRAAFEFLREHNPRAAFAQMDDLLATIRGLEDLSARGRPGRIAGTRELVARTGHVIAYLLRAEAVVILRIRNGRQDWPA